MNRLRSTIIQNQISMISQP